MVQTKDQMLLNTAAFSAESVASCCFGNGLYSTLKFHFAPDTSTVLHFEQKPVSQENVASV